jgi:hypothetical protein
MATVLLKKLKLQEQPINILTIIASLTLSAKYQDSLPQTIDYELVAHCCNIKNIQFIHVSLSFNSHNIFTILSHHRILNFIFSIFFHMMFVSQHLIISFLIYQILLIMIIFPNKSLNKLDLHYLLIHFQMKHLVSETKKIHSSSF